LFNKPTIFKNTMQKKQRINPKFLFIGLLALISTVFWLNFGKIRTLFSANPTSTTCDPYHYLDVPLYNQQSDVWCWAASIQMCIKYIEDDSIPQCKIAMVRNDIERVSPVVDICSFKIGKNCVYRKADNLFRRLLSDTTEQANTINAILDRYGLTTVSITSSLDSIKTFLCNDSPIIAILRNRRNSYHIVVVKGYEIVNGNTYLKCNNPLFDKKATCKDCEFILSVDDKADNMLPLTGTGKIKLRTYTTSLYLAVIPK
jgi:hypothetical protein